MPDVKVTILNKDRKIGAMVKALSFEVDGPKSVTGTSKEFLEKNGYYIFHFSSQEKALEFNLFDRLSELSNVSLIKPLDYLSFLYLISQSEIILTDSGGIQEEAPGLGKPVLVMRNTTERPEAVTAGTVELVGTKKELIVQKVNDLLTDSEFYSKMSKAHNPYGDGKACERIIKVMRNT